VAKRKRYFDNEYVINGDTTTIYIINRNGMIKECLISTIDLPKLIELNQCWYSYWGRTTKSYYFQTILKIKKDGKIKTTTLDLHRFLLCTDEYVDHINHNTLDNRRENLRVATSSQNCRNRKSRNINNKTGYRNVSFDGKRYIVQLQIDGKNKCLGKFDDVHEAGKFAEQKRNEVYGEFAGSS
jgi:DUF971 family protein